MRAETETEELKCIEKYKEIYKNKKIRNLV